MNNTVKRIIAIVTSAVLIGSGAYGASACAGSVYDEYIYWSQQDPRWADTPMGYSTIAGGGCLLTSLAIMAVHSRSIDDAALKNMGITDIEEFDPGVLANAYTAVGGFSGDGAIASWLTIEQIIPQIKWGRDAYFQSTEKSAVAAEMRSLMSEGWYIIARVVMPYGGYHWVFIEGVGDDDRIYMMDPAHTKRDLYDAYPGGIQGEYWILKGANPPDMDFVPPVDFGEALNGEFIVGAKGAGVYAEKSGGSPSQVIEPGIVVQLTDISGSRGKAASAEEIWLNLAELVPVTYKGCAPGDINGDGVCDRYDVGALASYLASGLPEGFSVLTAEEKSAADVNLDGVTDQADLAAMLDIIAEQKNTEEDTANGMD